MEAIQIKHEQQTAEVDSGQILSLVNQITNHSESTSYVLTPYAGCGCTTPMLDKQTISPGETIGMHVRFDSSGKHGNVKKDYGVTWTDEKGMFHRTIVKFTVKIN